MWISFILYCQIMCYLGKKTKKYSVHIGFPASIIEKCRHVSRVLFCHYHVLCMRELHTHVCLEHYKGPGACWVQYSQSADCACPTENSIIFFFCSESVRKKKKKQWETEFKTNVTRVVMLVGIRAARFSGAESRGTAG